MSDKPHTEHSQNKNIKNRTSFSEAEKIRQQLNDLPIQYDDTQTTAENKRPSGQDAAKGFAASMHVVSGVMVGGFLGYGFDYLFQTLPFGTVIMIPIGMIAGFRNMIRSLGDNTTQPEKSE